MRVEFTATDPNLSKSLEQAASRFTDRQRNAIVGGALRSDRRQQRAEAKLNELADMIYQAATSEYLEYVSNHEAYGIDLSRELDEWREYTECRDRKLVYRALWKAVQRWDNYCEPVCEPGD